MALANAEGSWASTRKSKSRPVIALCKFAGPPGGIARLTIEGDAPDFHVPDRKASRGALSVTLTL
jgi:hypothetical protein